MLRIGPAVAPNAERAVYRFLALLALTAGLALSAVGCSQPESAGDGAGETATSGTEKLSGEQIFAARCAVCHGAQGQGAADWKTRDEDGRLPPPPLNGDGHTWHHADGVLYRIVRDGGTDFGASGGSGSNMPSFGETLGREQIVEVLEYIKTLWADKTQDGLSIRETQRQISETDPYPAEG